MEDSEVVLVSERNNAGLKRLSQVLSEQTTDSPVNSMFRYGLSDIRINEGLLYANNSQFNCTVHFYNIVWIQWMSFGTSSWYMQTQCSL
jgi:hypothetical protein